MRAPDFWERDGLPARLLDPLGRVYAFAGRLRRRLTRPFRPPVPVVCVGNLSVGGTGKTPTAIAIARLLIEAGHRPHFLTRGYGGTARGPLRVELQHHDAVSVGDEPLLLAEVAPTWVARDRPAGARAALAAGADVLVMDDGLQNPSLSKDVALVVIDAEAGFGNGRVLPAGPLREPVAEGLARAHALVWLGPDDPALERALPKTLPRLRADLRPSGDAAAFRDRPVVAFAGIGRPKKFFSMLAGLGAQIAATRPFADHHVYTEAQIDALLALARRHDATLVTTAKDRVRLPRHLRERVAVLPVALVWHDSCEVQRVLGLPHGRSR